MIAVRICAPWVFAAAKTRRSVRRWRRESERLEISERSSMSLHTFSLRTPEVKVGGEDVVNDGGAREVEEE